MAGKAKKSDEETVADAFGRRGSDDILADLHAQYESLAGPNPVVDYASASYLRQQITAHETLARLRVERDERAAAGDAVIGVDAQIAYWLTMADENPADVPQPETLVLKSVDGENNPVSGEPLHFPIEK
jgi:hypothetical protein